MTPKTKVLKILDQYRDMSLTRGCEIFKGREAVVIDATEGDVYIKAYYKGAEVEDAVFTFKHFKEEDGVILGHPATPLVLLKAVQATLTDGYVMNYHTNEDGKLVMRPENKLIDIPFVTNLSEIPESDEMWQAVLDVLI